VVPGVRIQDAVGQIKCEFRQGGQNGSVGREKQSNRSKGLLERIATTGEACCGTRGFMKAVIAVLPWEKYLCTPRRRSASGRARGMVVTLI
jgi:hypothetical protein